MDITIEKVDKGIYSVFITNAQGGTEVWAENITWKRVMKLIKRSRKKLLV